MKGYLQLAKLIATTNSSQAFRIKGYKEIGRLNEIFLLAPSFSAKFDEVTPIIWTERLQFMGVLLCSSHEKPNWQ